MRGCCRDVILTLGLQQLWKETCPGWVTMMSHLLRWTCKRQLANKIPSLVVSVIVVNFLSLFVAGDCLKQQEWWVVPIFFQYLSRQLFESNLIDHLSTIFYFRLAMSCPDDCKWLTQTEHWNRNDESIESSQCGEVLGEASLPPAKTPSIVLFDGRGHGNSSGWTGGGPEQFHWKSLGLDMLQVAGAHRTCLSQPWAPSYIFGGCSMGAAAAVSWMHSVNS